MSVSLAPGITAPLESVTDPESDALTSCPKNLLVHGQQKYAKNDRPKDKHWSWKSCLA